PVHTSRTTGGRDARGLAAALPHHRYVHCSLIASVCWLSTNNGIAPGDDDVIPLPMCDSPSPTTLSYSQWYTLCPGGPLRIPFHLRHMIRDHKAIEPHFFQCL